MRSDIIKCTDAKIENKIFVLPSIEIKKSSMSRKPGAEVIPFHLRQKEKPPLAPMGANGGYDDRLALG